MKRILLIFTILALTACSNRIPAPVTPDGGDSSSSEVSGGGDSTDDGGEYYVLSSVEADYKFFDLEEHYTLLENPVYVTEQKTGKAMLKSCSMRYGEDDDDLRVLVCTYNFPKSVSEGVDNEVITYALNADGCILSYNYGTSGTAKNEYDSDRRLMRHISNGSQGTTYENYYYDNLSNLVRISNTYDSSSSLKGSCYDIEYTTIPAKSAPLHELHFETAALGFCEFFKIEAGLLGNSFIPKNLIKNIHVTIQGRDGASSTKYTMSYSYKLDDAGNVVEMKSVQSYVSSSLPDKIMTFQYKWKKSKVPTYAGWLLTSPDSPYNSSK